MSAPLATPHTPSLRRATESYKERVWRKFKEEPLVPIGTFATVGAFTMAAIKLRRRESRSLNYWMRVRVAAQAFTIAAVCAYYWSPRKDQTSERTQAQALAEESQSKRDELKEKERMEFQDRLKVAEAQWKETHKITTESKK